MRLVYRPLELWPGELTPEHRRQPSRFDASWTDTLDLLDREVRQLGGVEVVLQVAGTEKDMRLDGGLRADARPSHPGVIVSFTSRKHGPLRYSTDAFTWGGSGRLVGWQANVRAVALGLEALRRVDRYGIAKGGEQYVGWSALPSAEQSTERARTLLLAEAEMDPPWPEGPHFQVAVYRAALKRAHPDQGGSVERLTAVRDAARFLGLVEPVALPAGT